MSKIIPYFSAEEIAEKSYMIKNAFTENTPALCYLIEGTESAILIDTIIGMGNLKDFAETLTDKPIKVVNTHAHFDHVGCNFYFDKCYIHHKDIEAFGEMFGVKREQLFEMAKKDAKAEYRDNIVLDDNFLDWKPMKVIPVYGGEEFDLGDRRIEVVEAGGHTAGSIVLIDHKTRICYSGDACNSNTLLEFPNSLPIIEYMRTLLSLKERQSEFDKMYGGHEILDTSIIDEAIETVAKVIAGTDDKCERMGMMGIPVLYAAEKVKDGYERVDGKRFNMSYLPERIL